MPAPILLAFGAAVAWVGRPVDNARRRAILLIAIILPTTKISAIGETYLFDGEDVTRILHTSLGDWGSRVQISVLRPKILQEIKAFVTPSGTKREFEKRRTKPHSGGGSGHRPPESVALCSRVERPALLTPHSRAEPPLNEAAPEVPTSDAARATRTAKNSPATLLTQPRVGDKQHRYSFVGWRL
jgi:hypothetical protein